MQGAETAKAIVGPTLILEFASVSDGKQGVEKAANLLFAQYQGGDQDKPKFTEALLDEALRLVGLSAIHVIIFPKEFLQHDTQSPLHLYFVFAHRLFGS